MTASPRIRFLDRTTPPHIITLVLMSGLSALGMSIFLPSLPAMTDWFDTEYRLMQLSVALYLAMNALLQLVVGPISDSLGRRPVLIAGFLLFLAATLGCIYAPSAHAFLAFRMVQAVIVVALVLARAVVRDVYGSAQSAAMIGYVTMGMSVAPMIGPALGGLLEHQFGWQASFWMLFIGGALVTTLIWADLGETATARGQPLLAQLREYPILFASPRFWGYTITAATSSGSFFAYLGGAPFVGAEIFLLDPGALGLWLGAPAVGYFFGNFATARLVLRQGIDRLMLWGAMILSASAALSIGLFQAGIVVPVSFFAPMVLIGLGNGLVLPCATAGLLSVRPQLAGTASGLGGAMQIGGGAALSALAGALLGPGTGAFPLLAIMLVSSLAAVLASLYVIARNRRLAL